jgi:hypothetical protein
MRTIIGPGIQHVSLFPGYRGRTLNTKLTDQSKNNYRYLLPEADQINVFLETLGNAVGEENARADCGRGV